MRVGRRRVRGRAERRRAERVGHFLASLLNHLTFPSLLPIPHTLQTVVVAAVRAAVTLEPGSPERAAAVAAIRTATNAWVAKYRRDTSFSGKPSYGNTYSALNAVAGHINSFGPETALPKKRLERVIKELDDADKLIGRGR